MKGADTMLYFIRKCSHCGKVHDARKLVPIDSMVGKELICPKCYNQRQAARWEIW